MKNKLRYALLGAMATLISGSFGVAAQQAPTVVAPPPTASASVPSQAGTQMQTTATAPQLPVATAPQAAPVQQQIPVAPVPVSLPTELPPLPPYQLAVEQQFPATPAQIEALRRRANATQQAVAKPVAPAKPHTGSISVSLSPGSTPPKIRAYYGNTSSIVVVDSSGAPWPVENFRIGNGAAFQLNRMDGPQGSSFALDANLAYAQSNMILQLAGSKSPVVVEIVAGQPDYDARLEIRVQGRGPNSAGTVANTLPAGTDGRLLSILDGVAPAGSKALNVAGDAQAWMLPSGRMVVRTPMKIVSPAPTSFVSSADGTHVYEFMPTSDLLGMSNGEFVNLTVRGW